MNIKIEPFKERYNGMDCVTLSISNILKYKGYKNYTSVWKQCGMNLYYKDNQKLPIIDGKFMQNSDELLLIHGIKSVYYETFDSDVFLSIVKELIDRGEPVIIYADTYYLEFNLHYKKNHFNHCLIITDYNAETFTVVDDFYSYKGYISIETLLKSSKLPSIWPTEKPPAHKYFFLSLPEDPRDNFSKDDYLKVIKLNIESLEGTTSPLEILKSLNYPPQTKIISGIQAIPHYIKVISEYNEDLNSLFFKDLYGVLSRISNTRYHFSRFLNDGEYANDFNIIINQYADLGQQWKVAANTALKGVLAKPSAQKDLFCRLLNKLELINQMEIKALEICKKIELE